MALLEGKGRLANNTLNTVEFDDDALASHVISKLLSVLTGSGVDPQHSAGSLHASDS